MVLRLPTCLLPLLLVFSVSATALQYRAPLNHAEWRLELSRFECRMWQPIPSFGDAVFAHRAGEEQRFYLAPVSKSMQPGKAALQSRAPQWDEAKPVADMGLVTVSGSSRAVDLGRRMSFQLLHELYEGMSPVFSRFAWYDDKQPIEVALSSVNFRRAYSQYRNCLASLLPVNFDQINRSRIQFQTAKHELTPSSERTLQHIVEYVKADPTVTGFFIDGHTDSVGRRLANLDLSKRRAETVLNYLVEKGVDAALITTRYHGERYPLVSNNSAKNRAINRRVTIRLERDQL